MLSTFDRRVQKVVLDRNLATEQEVNEVVDETEEMGEDGVSLADELVKSGLVNSDELISHIGLEMDIPPVDLERIKPEEEALEAMGVELVSYYNVLPIARANDLLTIAVANPFDLQKLDDIRLVTDCEIQTVVSTERQIQKAIDRFYREDEDEALQTFMDMEMDMEEGEADDLELQEDEQEEVDLSEISEEAGESKVVRLVNTIIKDALEKGVSDIHIEPYEKRIRVRFRKDGVLSTEIEPPKKLHSAMVSRIKIMSDLDIAERRQPQDGKFQMQYEGRKIDFRVSVLPTVHGEKVVLRLLDSSDLGMNLDDLGFEERALNHFREAINQPWGMILVTGPTGSGKSTTLYSAIQEVQTPKENIVTVEDPVEYQVDGIVQTQVEDDQGLTFAKALRSILRQDPDTVLVGEIRDLETADIAVKAALTGHLVLSTLHTNDAASAIARLTDMGVDDFMVSSSVNLVSAQRLMRELCDNCKQPMEMPDWDFLLRIGFSEEQLSNDPTFYEAVGCDQCLEGYTGRFAILETIKVDEQLRKMILDGASTHALKEYSINELGMLTLRQSALKNVLKGKTSIEESLRVTMAD